mgnify:CR=1 FL=1
MMSSTPWISEVSSIRKIITADYILQYVRATQNSIGSNVETLYHILDGNAEALEFAIREESAVTYIPLAELNLRKNLLVGCLNRNGRIRIPRGQDMIQVGDTVIIVTTHKGLRDITDILEKIEVLPNELFDYYLYPGMDHECGGCLYAGSRHHCPLSTAKNPVLPS